MSAAGGAARPTILVVEDNEITRKMMRVALSGGGYRVVEAGDGGGALARVAQERPDLVLQDLLLPDVDGVELAGRIRQLPGGADLPIVAVSGVVSRLDEADTIRAAFTDYLFKPIAPSQLLETVARHLRARPGPGAAVGRGRRVLVVDDDPIQRKLQRIHLEQAGFRVELAAGAAEGLAAMRADPPDAVLCDMLMPRMSGLDFCVAVRAEQRFDAVPVVLASAVFSQLDDDDQALFRHAGANAMVPRTAGMDEAVAALAAALDGGLPPPGHAAPSSEVRTEWTDRLVHQLEHQAALAATLARRSAVERAQISIMSGAAEVLATTADLKRALDEVLRRVLDAGGLSAGAIFLLREDEGAGLTLVSHLGFGTPPDGALARLLARAGLLSPGAERVAPLRVPAGEGATAEEAAVLEPMRVRSMVAAPLVSAGEALGVLLMSSNTLVLGPEWVAAARAIAVHLAQAVALARTLGKLANSEQRFRGLFEGTPAALYRCDAAGRLVDANPMLVALLGYTSLAELLGAGVSVAGTRPDEAARWDEALAGRGTAALEVRLARADGRWMTLENTVHPARGPDGRVAHCDGALVDVTEHRRAAGDLREAQARLEHVLSASGAVIYALEHEAGRSHPLWVSGNLHRILGYPTEDALRPAWWRERVHPDDAARVADDMEELLRKGSRTREYRFRHADGRYRWVLDDQRVVKGGAAGGAEVVGAWIDVTERHTLEQELLQAQKMESVGRLAGGIAHDFNNLLTVITACADLLLADFAPEDERRADVEEIRDAARRSAALTRQLLAFSRRQLMQPRVLALNEVIAGTERLLRRVIGEDLTLVCELDPALGPTLADQGQLEQVLLNLTVNARDAMPGGGTLTIRTLAAAPDDAARAGLDPELAYVGFEVADTGVGMDADTLSHLFEPFFTTKAPGQGTGLGLATVYGIVKQSGGAVTVRSEPGRGSAFRVLLPRVEPGAGEKDDAAPGPAQGGAETILVVEDEPGVRRVTVQMLARLGYSALDAEGPADAEARFLDRAGEIDLLLTDVVMPGMRGDELAARFRARNPGLRVLYTSGYLGDTVGVLPSEHGGATFLPKPFSQADLARQVRAVLAHSPPPPPPTKQ